MWTDDVAKAMKAIETETGMPTVCFSSIRAYGTDSLLIMFSPDYGCVYNYKTGGLRDYGVKIGG